MRYVRNGGAALALAAALAACATGYQSSGLTGGFEETQLAPNVFQVRFQGNAYTKPERAADYALLRSAEVVLENGFTHFAIVDSKDAAKLGTWTTPGRSTTTIDARTRSGRTTGTATTTQTGGQTVVYQKPSTSNTIVCFKGQPELDAIVYDAAFLRASLRKKYGMKD
jgi:hypothetical protein